MEYITAKEFVSKLQVLSDLLDGFAFMYDDHLPIDDNPLYNDFQATLGLVFTSLNRLSKSIDTFRSKLVQPTLF